MKRLLHSVLGLLFLGLINVPISTPLSLGQAAQKSASVDPSKDLDEAGRLNGRVIKLFAEGKFDEALALAKRVLEIREVNLEAADDGIGVAVLNLAEIYKAKKKLSDAQALFERALVFYEKKLGPEDLKVAAVLDRLGRVYLNRSNYSESESALKRVLSIREKIYGVKNLTVTESLHDLAEFYRYRGDLKKAEPLFDRALMIMQETLPLDRPAARKLLEHYSCVYYQSGQMEKLKGLAQKYIPKEESSGSDLDKSLRGGVLNGKAIKLPRPTYPDEARRARAQGLVIVAVTIAETGKVIEAHDMCGTNPLLARVSIEAAFKAEFTPTKLSGQPVKVTGIITYNFVAR